MNPQDPTIVSQSMIINDDDFDFSEENAAHRLVAQSADAGQRIDQYLVSQVPGYSRAQWQRQITDAAVLVNERPVKASYRVQPQDIITVELPTAPLTNLIAEALPLDIVYEDAALLVVNKPAGLVVHPAAGVDRGTLANALVAYLQPELLASQQTPSLAQISDSMPTGHTVPTVVNVVNSFSSSATDYKRATLTATGEKIGNESSANRRPGIVHRLDRDTSGLLVVAKTETAYQHLTAQFAARTVEKRYLALVYGSLASTSGVIDLPIGRHKTQRTKMCVAPGWGRAAYTRYQVGRRWPEFSLLTVVIKTGRTHQIRVHLAHHGHPVVADEVYGAGRVHNLKSPQIQKAIRNLGRHWLHAQFLALQHPITLERLQFEAPVPANLTDLLTQINGSPLI